MFFFSIYAALRHSSFEWDMCPTQRAEFAEGQLGRRENFTMKAAPTFVRLPLLIPPLPAYLKATPRPGASGSVKVAPVAR
jgi:hypothetical protein